MTAKSLTLGTRSSRLALIQTKHVAELIQRKFPDLHVKVKKITTHGDRSAAKKPIEPGWFVGEIEQSLLRSEIDLAVHSAKDLPIKLAAGLVCRTAGDRADPRDCLISRGGKKLAELPAGSKIGTSSPRRSAQILKMKPDANIVPLRGNVETRLSKVTAGEIDAVVLAVAGLVRLGLTKKIAEFFEMPTAAGQGALMVEWRAQDSATAAIVAKISVKKVERCVHAEREFLRKNGGGCYDTIGATAHISATNRVVLKSFTPRP